MSRKGASGQIWQIHCFKIEATHEINVFTSLDKRPHLAKTLFILHKYLKYMKYIWTDFVCVRNVVSILR